MRGNFLQNFIDVLLGFVLVTFLPVQFFSPPQPEFVNSIVRKELAKRVGQQDPHSLSVLTEKVKLCAQECASDYKDQRVNPFTINSEYTIAFCNRLEKEWNTVLAQVNPGERDTLASLMSDVRNALSAGCSSGSFLFLAILLFTIKYLHELSRIEDLFHVGVVLPAIMNFLHFFCSLFLAGAIILLILYSTTSIPWWLPVGILIGFALNDSALLIAKMSGRLKASVAKGRYVQGRIIGTWIFLDVIILVFLLIFCVANSPHDLSPTSWNRLLAWLLLVQVGVPYVVGFDFYFKDYIDEAAAA